MIISWPFLFWGNWLIISQQKAPAVVTVTDYISNNGVIHVIDKVISPADNLEE